MASSSAYAFCNDISENLSYFVKPINLPASLYLGLTIDRLFRLPSEALSAFFKVCQSSKLFLILKLSLRNKSKNVWTFALSNIPCVNVEECILERSFEKPFLYCPKYPRWERSIGKAPNCSLPEAMSCSCNAVVNFSSLSLSIPKDL